MNTVRRALKIIYGVTQGVVLFFVAVFCYALWGALLYTIIVDGLWRLIIGVD
jgi:hypothetical protein